jgi:glycosyltransferase involved in cell wall biosynthesis
VKNLKVAIVHDWIVGGGAENVVLELHRMFPEAPIFTSYCRPEWREKLDGKIVTGFLQRWPFSKLRKYLPVLRIWWFTHLDFSGYDLVISSSGNGEAKGVCVPKVTTHICYCHTPTHFYWRHYDTYLKNPGFGVFNPLARLGLRTLAGPLRKWDIKASKRPDYFIANSTHTQADIKKYYGRDSVVIHPPVDVERISKIPAQKRHGFITVGRQVPYKRTDIIVRACAELNLPIRVIGRGPGRDALEQIAGPNTIFITNATDVEIGEHLASAEAFLFAAFEDFGVTPVEAMAAGTPVIAYKAGGALDYVIPGKTGEFFAAQTPQALEAAIKSFKPQKYSADDIKTVAEAFSKKNFRQNLEAYIKDVLQ